MGNDSPPPPLESLRGVSFGSSLWGPTPLVERYARMQHSDLTAAELRHCRSVTICWCLFFVLNGAAAAVLAVSASTASWALYTGVISYVLLGALFAAEFTVRKIRFRRYGSGLIDRLFERYFPAPRSTE